MDCASDTTNGRDVPVTVACLGVVEETDFVVAVRVTGRTKGFVFELFERVVETGSARVVAETFVL
jgi:hypothetical protein